MIVNYRVVPLKRAKSHTIFIHCVSDTILSTCTYCSFNLCSSPGNRSRGSSMLQLRELKHREIKHFTEDHTASKWYRQDLSPGGLAPGF